MTASTVETLAMSYVEHNKEVAALMRSQHQLGRITYGHPIDEWPAKLPEQVSETIREGVDLITYLTRIDPEAFVLDCHRIATICNDLIRYRDRMANDPMRSVRP